MNNNLFITDAATFAEEDLWSSSSFDDAACLIRKDDSTGAFWCTECHYRASHKHHVKRHVESRHLNLVYTCPVCLSTFRGKHLLQDHLRRRHNSKNKFIAAAAEDD